MKTVFDTPASQLYSASNSHRPINFYCSAPGAKSVHLAGDFSRWHPIPMSRRVDGWWFIQVELPHGHHHYHFLVDGQPMLDPRASGTILNELREKVSLVAVS